MDNVIPSKQAVMIGKTVEFTCLSLKAAKWTFDDGKLPNNVEVVPGLSNTNLTFNILRINGVDFSNAGLYGCEGVDAEKKWNFYGIGELSVIGKCLVSHEEVEVAMYSNEIIPDGKQ